MRIVMMGTGLFAEPTFEALLEAMKNEERGTGNEEVASVPCSPSPVLHSSFSRRVVGLVTQPDRDRGQVRGSTRQTGRGLKAIAAAHNVPVFQPESINTPHGIAQLREWQPDLLVVAAYGQILSRDVLAVPPQGGINVHGSTLPRYRGAAPIAHALLNGETRVGVTIIRMSVALDAGDMLAQEAIEVGADETAGEVEARLAPLGARLAMQVIEQIQAGTTQGVKQDPALVTKAPKLTKEHGAIDWHKHGRDVVNRIRAMQPWPTAYTFWHRSGQKPLRLILLRATWRLAGPGEDTTPGMILGEEGDLSRLGVMAGEGTVVEVTELQPDGKRRMAAADFLRGRRPRPGDFLGPEPG